MQVTLKNYRCFRDATLRLTPLTVILGPNASGKTGLLRALDPRAGLTFTDVWQRKRGLSIHIQRRREGNRIVSTRFSNDTEVETNGHDADYSFQALELEPNDLRSPNQLTLEYRLNLTGSNLTNVFSATPRTTQAAIAQQFCKLVPVFSDVDKIPGPNPGEHTLRFQDRWNPAVWYSPDQVSDGSMLTLAFLMLQHQTPPVDVLTIEDPERGLHPYLIGELIELLRRLATGADGTRPMKIVIATHSPVLLDFVRPEELRVLKRENDGSVTIHELPVTDLHWRDAFKVYGESLGTAWLSGNLGGVPGH